MSVNQRSHSRAGALFILIALIAAACARPPAPTPAPMPTATPLPSPVPTATPVPTLVPTATPPPSLIKPGDSVNGILIATGSDDSTYAYDLPCKQEKDVWKCPATCGEAVNPLSVFYDRDIKKLQDKWNTLEYTATIEGRQVDLAAFGTVDFVDSKSGVNIRTYNLALRCSEPASVTVIDKGSLAGEEFGDTMTFVFEPAGVKDSLQPLASAAERLGQHPYRSEKTSFELLLYLPGDYGKDPGRTWPLILFLHYGENVTSLDWIRTEYLASRLDNQLEFPFIVASPLHTGEYQHWSQPAVMDELAALTAELESLLAVNPDQVYLAGVIEGANGVWELGIAHPELFAALVPLGGYTGYPFSVPENICALKDTPVRAFHGTDDPDIPISAQQMLVDALKACGNENVKLTTLPGANFDIKPAVFDDQNLYSWLLEQSR